MQEGDEIPLAKEILNRPSEGVAGRIHILHYCNYLMGNHLSEVGGGGRSSAVANGCFRSIWEGELQEASVYAEANFWIFFFWLFVSLWLHGEDFNCPFLCPTY